jgi:hypothetical protein
VLSAQVERLRLGRAVLDLLGAAKGLERLGTVSSRVVSNFDSARRADRVGDRGRADVVGRFPEVVGVVLPEGVPQAEQLAVDRLDVRACGVAAILGFLASRAQIQG